MMETIFGKIKHGMELAFFASAFADLREEEGEPLRGEVMDQLPDIIDPAAKHAAETLHLDLVTRNPQIADRTLVGVYNFAVELFERADADRELTPELFGHYLAMQAMGTGVGLESFGSAVREAITVPYEEFGSHSLQYDYD